jgi:hypothetical protein
MSKTHSNHILSAVAQKHIKKYKHLRMSVLRETFEIDYAVALTQHTCTHCSLQRDEKHTQ